MSVAPNPVNGRINDGTYVIHSVQDKKEDERLVLTAKNAAVVTEKDVFFKWKVVYYEDDDNYSIEDANAADKYVVTQAVDSRTEVFTGKSVQRFKISPVPYMHAVYYEIITEDSDGDITFMCLGKGRQASVVPLPDSPNPSIIWDFEECSPYTRSLSTDFYFDKNPEGELQDRFGLLNQFTWKKLWDGIDKLHEINKKSIFKLFFLGRHGNDEHNVKRQLKADYEGFDAELTQFGYLEAGRVRSIWDSARAETDGIGLPQLSFCSPMRRALVTNTVTFSSELSAKSTPTTATMFTQNCRERCYIDDSEKRHSKRWIQEMFRYFDAEDLTDSDELWDPRYEEPFPHFRARGRAILDRVFKSDKSSKFVSITAHHEWCAMLMEVLGEPGTMDKFRLEEGGVIPVIVQYKTS